MTERIDLGKELANYGNPKREPAAGGICPDFYKPGPDGGTTAKLADLQAQGFNTMPPWRFHTGTPAWTVVIGDKSPSLYDFTITDAGMIDE